MVDHIVLTGHVLRRSDLSDMTHQYGRYLGKKYIHTSDSFLHSNYCGIMINEYTINIVYLYFCYMLIVMLLLLSIKY